MEKENLVYPDESFKIVGLLFEVYNNLGCGHYEKFYYNAIEENLRKNGFKVKKQIMIPIKFRETKVGKYFADFLLDDKIILEIKVGDRFYKNDIYQAYAYLRGLKKKLAIIALFTKKGLRFKRIVNIK